MMKELIKRVMPYVFIEWYYFFLEFLAALWYGFPGLKLKVIGVTGTKGKSTTVYLITRILEEAGLGVASVSSIEFRIGRRSRVNDLKMTLPSRFLLQTFFAHALRQKVDYVLSECTSQGLAQHRVSFVNFIVAVFTNLAPEHIEAHGSYEKYRQAKMRLFQLLSPHGMAVINEDDLHAAYFKSFFTIVKKDVKTIFFGRKDRKKIEDIKLKLLGEFNEYNALAAYSTCEALGIGHEAIKKALEKIAFIPGRLEEINEEQNFRVFIDYAHNPSSLEAVLKTMSNVKDQMSKVIVVTGAQGGGRDKWKRPEIGRIATQYADVVIITNEDPYQEDPQRIIEDVYDGTQSVFTSEASVLRRQGRKAQSIVKILDRKEAIKRALQMAQKGDIVLIAGKGSETVMETPRGKIPWNEREIVRELLKHVARSM